jgi:hypothetical protein
MSFVMGQQQKTRIMAGPATRRMGLATPPPPRKVSFSAFTMDPPVVELYQQL